MFKVIEKIKEYLRLGRLFNAEILSLIFVLSYLLTAKLHTIQNDYRIIFTLFLAGIFAHVWGCYNNDRLDLTIDKNASYCIDKPLVSGKIKQRHARIIENTALLIFIFLVLYSSYISNSQTTSIFISPRIISTIFFLFCAISLAYLYNRFNKSNIFINITGQMYATFAVLIGMSIVTDYNIIVFLSAILIGLNGVYLNIIEADLKDIKGDIVNVPKSLGVRFIGEKAVNLFKFYILNETIKTISFLLVLLILFLEKVEIIFYFFAFGFYCINVVFRIFMFKNLSANREKMKRFIAVQELSSILFICTIYMIVNPLLIVVIPLFIVLWLSIWNMVLWNTFFRPQV